MKKTCDTCEWLVDDTNGEYSHKEAKEKGEGFCVLAELFTFKSASDQACKEYQREHD